jgi:hypothetical protein
VKPLTCRELGGTCDEKLSVNSWDEMGEARGSKGTDGTFPDCLHCTMAWDMSEETFRLSPHPGP